MKKKLFSVLLICVMVLAFAAPVMAADALQHGDVAALLDTDAAKIAIPAEKEATDTLTQEEAAAYLLLWCGMDQSQLGTYPADWNAMALSAAIADLDAFDPTAPCTEAEFEAMKANAQPLYDALHADKMHPLFINGVAQPIFPYTSGAVEEGYSNADSDIIRYFVYVETNYDTDSDGKLDLVKALVQVPRAAVEGDYKAATIYEARPYITGCTPLYGYDSDVYGTEGYDMDDPNYDGGYLTDSMILVSLNQDTGDVKAINLPRDLHYTKGACTGTAKLNEIFWCNYSLNDGTEESIKTYEKQGQDALAAAFEDILGVTIQYKVHANWAAVVDVVNALGGIDVVFTYGEEHWDGPETAIEVSDPRGLSDAYGWEVFYEYPTMQVIHLDGGDALAVARTRNSHGGYGAVQGNFSREYFQQKIIEATVKKARETNFVTDLSAATGLLNAVGDNIRTTFQDSDIKTLMRLAKEININNMETLSTVENYDGRAALMTTGMVNGISYVLPYGGDMYFSNIRSFIQERLYAEGFSREMAQVVVLNGTETPGTAAEEQLNLEDEGFTIYSIGNAPDDLQNAEKTTVYQLNDTKPETAKKLAEKYGVELVTDIPESLSEYTSSSDDTESVAADFIVIIGNDHFESAD